MAHRKTKGCQGDGGRNPIHLHRHPGDLDGSKQLQRRHGAKGQSETPSNGGLERESNESGATSKRIPSPCRAAEIINPAMEGFIFLVWFCLSIAVGGMAQSKG